MGQATTCTQGLDIGDRYTHFSLPPLEVNGCWRRVGSDDAAGHAEVPRIAGGMSRGAGGGYAPAVGVPAGGGRGA